MSEPQLGPKALAADLELADSLNIGIGVDPPLAVIVEGWGRQIGEIRSIRHEGIGQERLVREAAGNALSGIVRHDTPRRVEAAGANVRVRLHVPERVATAGLVLGQLTDIVRDQLPEDTAIRASGTYPANIADGLARFGNRFLSSEFMTPTEDDVGRLAREADRLLVFTDASFKPDEDAEDGEHSGYGYLIVTPTGLIIDLGAGGINSVNSMLAEAEALYIGLARAADFSKGKVTAHTDTKHIPLSFNRQSTFNDDRLNEVMERCHSALYRFDDVRVQRIPREHNEVADQLARQGRYAPVRLRDLEESGQIQRDTNTKYST